MTRCTGERGSLLQREAEESTYDKFDPLHLALCFLFHVELLIQKRNLEKMETMPHSGKKKNCFRVKYILV